MTTITPREFHWTSRASGGAIHVAIWVPYEQAEARVAAAVAVGRRMVRDEFAPSWWTLADAQATRPTGRRQLVAMINRSTA